MILTTATTKERARELQEEAEKQGFEPTVLQGPDTKRDDRFKDFLRSQKNPHNTAHLAYTQFFWPLLAEGVKNWTDEDYIVVAEDSCWLTVAATPERLWREANDAKMPVWVGSCNKPKHQLRGCTKCFLIVDGLVSNIQHSTRPTCPCATANPDFDTPSREW